MLIEVVHAPDLRFPAAVLTGSPYLIQARVPKPAPSLLVRANIDRAVIDQDLQLARSVLHMLAEQLRARC